MNLNQNNHKFVCFFSSPRTQKKKKWRTWKREKERREARIENKISFKKKKKRIENKINR